MRGRRVHMRQARHLFPLVHVVAVVGLAANAQLATVAFVCLPPRCLLLPSQGRERLSPGYLPGGGREGAVRRSIEGERGRARAVLM